MNPDSDNNYNEFPVNPDSDNMSTEDLVMKVHDDDLAHLKKDCPYDITDRVFLIIERKYFRIYSAMCSAAGKDKVNSYIAGRCKLHWNLMNTGRRCTEPESSLIKSYSLLYDI